MNQNRETTLKAHPGVDFQWINVIFMTNRWRCLPDGQKRSYMLITATTLRKPINWGSSAEKLSTDWKSNPCKCWLTLHFMLVITAACVTTQLWWWKIFLTHKICHVFLDWIKTAVVLRLWDQWRSDCYQSFLVDYSQINQPIYSQYEYDKNNMVY